MRKIIASILVILAAIIGVSIYFSPEKSEVEKDNKKSQAFEKSKTEVVAQPISWAKGVGVPQGAVVTSSYIVVDKNGDVIFSQNPDTKQSPASLAKLMTAMVALDLANPTDLLTVHKEATLLEPTILRAREGEQFTIEELLTALLVYSANDAAEILAQEIGKKIGGDRTTFIDLMNEKSKRMNLSQTRFANPSGFDDSQQYSTARELSIITQYALNNYSDILKIIKIREITFEKNSYHEEYKIVNWNSLIDIYPGVIGVKIGHTDQAGHATIIVSERENERMMSVLIGAPDRRARDLWTVDLLNSAFEQKGIGRFRVTRDMLIARSNEWSKILYENQNDF